MPLWSRNLRSFSIYKIGHSGQSCKGCMNLNYGVNYCYRFLIKAIIHLAQVYVDSYKAPTSDL